MPPTMLSVIRSFHEGMTAVGVTDSIKVRSHS